MTTEERRKKLAQAESKWRETRRKIHRLQTAEVRWFQRMQYHMDKMEIELTLERQQFEAEKMPTGRKFRTLTW